MYYIDLQDEATIARYKLSYGVSFKEVNMLYLAYIKPDILLPLVNTDDNSRQMLSAKHIYDNYLGLVRNADMIVTDDEIIRLKVLKLDCVHTNTKDSYLRSYADSQSLSGYYIKDNKMFYGKYQVSEVDVNRDSVVYLGSNGRDLITRNVLQFVNSGVNYARVRFNVFKDGDLFNSAVICIGDIDSLLEYEEKQILSLLEG